jgi:hypothetical protein
MDMAMYGLACSRIATGWSSRWVVLFPQDIHYTDHTSKLNLWAVENNSGNESWSTP